MAMMERVLKVVSSRSIIFLLDGDNVVVFINKYFKMGVNIYDISRIYKYDEWLYKQYQLLSLHRQSKDALAKTSRTIPMPTISSRMR